MIGYVVFVSLNFANLSKGAVAGDAVNGLSAPLIGLLGAFLVFISFREQVKANKIQFQVLNEQRELDLFYRLYEELKIDLQRIQIEYGPKYNQTSVLDSMMGYLDQNQKPPYDELNSYVYYIFSQFIFLGKRIGRTKNINDSEVVYLIEKTDRLYELYFAKHYKRLFTKFFDNEYVQYFKRSFDEVGEIMETLDQIRKEKKDLLRIKANK